jgi:hypothetical protein
LKSLVHSLQLETYTQIECVCYMYVLL